MGRAGRARVEREFSLDSMVAAYLALYESLLGGQVQAATPPPRA
jgi:glycosyltransferase involved in cell wall biosynthesis